MTPIRRSIAFFLYTLLVLMLTAMSCVPPENTTASLTANPTEGFAGVRVDFDAQGMTEEPDGLSALNLRFCSLDFDDPGRTPPIESFDIDATGNSCELRTPHTYLQEGTYEPTLRVGGPDGLATDTVTIQVGITEFTADPATPSPSENVDFNYDGPPATSCEFDAGDGSDLRKIVDGPCVTGEAGIVTSFSFAAPGTYSVRVTARWEEDGAIIASSSKETEVVVSGDSPGPTPGDPPTERTNLKIPVTFGESLVLLLTPLTYTPDTLAPAALDPCPQVMVAASGIDGGNGGGAVVDACTGDLIRGYPVASAGEPAWFDAMILEVPAGKTGNDLLVRSGLGYALQMLDADGNPDGFTQVNPPGSGPFLHAQPLGGDVTAGALILERARVQLLRWSDAAGTFAGDRTINAFELDPVVTYELRSAAGDASGEHLLMAAVASTGEGALLYVEAPTGGALSVTNVGVIGGDPGRLACDLSSGLCALSDRSDDTVTAIVWDGSSAPTIGAAAPVGELPVGIDVLGLRVVSAGFDDDTYTVTTFDAAGALVTQDTQPVPTGCSEPGHAIFLGSDNDAVLVSCFDSGSLAYIPNAF